ncbi:hypothetical protein [Solirubrobacter phytolaccae]|uniref:hypothetical protein n=1 Tax=Solirubrobacter phytolaccae TaxID=1404360 RepID=UPI0022CE258B|nr:hypothetical protein [Solirubrobacter phytolaccae]
MSVVLSLTGTASASVRADWGGHAAAAAALDVPLPPSVYIHLGGCPEAGAEQLACSSPVSDQVWIPREDATDWFTLGHEIGHQFDRQVLTEDLRWWLRGLMRADGRGEWFREKGPNEWFADFYALCAMGFDRRPRNEAHMAYLTEDPSPRRLRRVCTAIRMIGLATSTRS